MSIIQVSLFLCTFLNNYSYKKEPNLLKTRNILVVRNKLVPFGTRLVYWHFAYSLYVQK